MFVMFPHPFHSSSLLPLPFLLFHFILFLVLLIISLLLLSAILLILLIALLFLFLRRPIPSEKLGGLF